MSITAKELAKKMGLSATAVSMALNNKPGVSTETRNKVVREAEKCGYDFSRIRAAETPTGSIYIIFYKTHNAILSYTPIFNEIYDGVARECQKAHYSVRMVQFYEKTDNLEDLFADLRVSNCVGIILIGTEIRKDACQKFLEQKLPVILLDTYYEALDCTSVVINNGQGAYLATDYLISLNRGQPGHLRCSYTIPNFTARNEGYEKALRESGYSPSRSIVHVLTPSIESAMSDMLEIIDRGDPLADCYFADNDILAIGAIKAFQLRGRKVPDDISVIGFDNINESRIIEPALTTMDVPRYYLGQTAARLMIERLGSKVIYNSKVEISARLVKRLSHCKRSAQA